MEEIITMTISVVIALGGFEFIKWLFNRKSDSRVAEANADSVELKNDVDEFHFLKERIEFKDKQLIEKEERFAKQNEYAMELNRQLLEQTIENGKLKAEISELKAERSMKLCQVRNCTKREPQSGY
ncbi:MAG: hypothetical protein E7066_06195 [Lentimicrobiaceae bacterium]|nr:hypothetical protein [Lentimicrobiaceae bacterium]